MHANQRMNAHGQKTRLLADMQEEIRVVFEILARYGVAASGIHLEMTPEDLIECVEETDDLSQPLTNYRSACDPRLNADQSVRIAEFLAQQLRRAGPIRGAL
jgi:3-deoxy-D-arabino-heptulosonate 7-phosphate (DAHP) synthase class II